MAPVGVAGQQTASQRGCHPGAGQRWRWNGVSIRLSRERLTLPMAAEEWRSVALVGDTATAAERDMSPKAHCIDANSGTR